MALLYADGFDLASKDRILHAYTYRIDIDQGAIVDGRYTSDGLIPIDRAHFLQNTGFGFVTYEAELGGQLGEVIIGMDVKPTKTAGADQIWDGAFVLASNTTAIKVSGKAKADGRIEFWRGGFGTGTKIAETNPGVLVFGEWTFLEFKFTIPQGIVVKKEGTEVLNAPGAIIHAGGPDSFFTRAGYGHGSLGSLGPALDNLYVLTTGAGHRTTFLGKIRIGTNWPKADGPILEFSPSTGLTHFNLVDDRDPPVNADVPDGDVTYVSATGEKIDLFQMERINPIGQILGLQVSASARSVDTSVGGQLKVVARSPGGVNFLSPTLTFPANYIINSFRYKTVRYVWEKDPATGLDWSEGDIFLWRFGVQNLTPTELRLTQVTTEKITSPGGVSSFAIYKAR